MDPNTNVSNASKKTDCGEMVDLKTKDKKNQYPAAWMICVFPQPAVAANTEPKPERKPSQTLPSVHISLGIMPCPSPSSFHSHPAASPPLAAYGDEYTATNHDFNLNQSCFPHSASPSGCLAPKLIPTFRSCKILIWTQMPL